MNLKTILNYSPNFNTTKRTPKQIKFIIFHYTGMKKEFDSINRLTSTLSKVSSHYFIKNNGQIITLVPDLYIAWHAGVSSWKNYKFLNKHSIGIEISNPGHEFNYKKFSKKQIKSILRLTKFLIKKYKIKSQNILGHSDIAPTRKKDPGEKFPWEYLSSNKIGIWHKLNKKKLEKNRYLRTNDSEKNSFYKNLKLIGYPTKIVFKDSKISINKYTKIITKAFQRRFRQDQINGIIDQECLMISENLAKILS
jgi:N-acetylmuramoyl-L-alanine amidase